MCRRLWLAQGVSCSLLEEDYTLLQTLQLRKSFLSGSQKWKTSTTVHGCMQASDIAHIKA